MFTPALFISSGILHTTQTWGDMKMKTALPPTAEHAFLRWLRQPRVEQSADLRRALRRRRALEPLCRGAWALTDLDTCHSAPLRSIDT
jgi:hypothetical protein